MFVNESEQDPSRFVVGKQTPRNLGPSFYGTHAIFCLPCRLFLHAESAVLPSLALAD